MTDAELIEQINGKLGSRIRETANPAPLRIFLTVEPADLPSLVAGLRDDFGYTHLSTITGLDLGEAFEILYHFGRHQGALTVRTQVPRDKPNVPTITPVIPGAILYEREIQEMFGITVVDIPDPRRLNLPDDWPDGQYPLRKDWSFERPEEIIPGGRS